MKSKTEIVSIRLTAEQSERLHALAMDRGLTTSDLIRRLIKAEIEQPIGWRCKHVTMYAPPAFARPSFGCGCPPAAMFEGDADITGQN